MIFKSLFSVVFMFMATYSCFAGGGIFNPDFNISKTTLKLEEAVTFTDNSDRGSCSSISGWEWDFGSGASPAISNLQNPPPVTYSTPGIKSVRLTVSGPSCNNQFTMKAITVENAPIPTMSQWSLFVFGLIITSLAVGKLLLAARSLV